MPNPSWIPIVGVLALAAIIAVTIVAVNPNQTGTVTISNPTSTSASLPINGTTSLSTSNYNSTLGLRLSLNVSNSRIPQDDGVSIRIALNNTLATQNNLPPLNATASTWQPSWNLQPCTTWPIGVQIFQGNYAPGNLSFGSPLGLLVPSGYNCADHPPLEISFAPMSGNVTSPAVWWINQTSDRTEYWGYWTGSEVPPSNNASFTSFTPSTYTIEGEDWWGQVTLLHFQVVTNPSTPSCSTISSSPSFVKGTNFSTTEGPLKLIGYYAKSRTNTTAALELTTTNTTGTPLTVGMVSLKNPFTNEPNYVYAPFEFSPNANLSQTWQYYSPDGTLSEPMMFLPNECSLLVVEFPASYQGVPLVLYVGNAMETFTLSG